MRNKIIVWTIGLIFIDQITKLIFSHRDFFLGFIHFHLVKNSGLSFGLNFGTTINIAAIILALMFFGYYFYSHRGALTNKQLVALVLIFTGAICNIGDRAALGYVRDFLDIGLGFTFNLADVFVTVGLLIVLLQ